MTATMIAVIGPSGAGKSTIVRALAERGVVRVHPTWTTRPSRPDERARCLEHRFVDEATFDALVARGFFAATAAPFGLPHRYGVPRLVAGHAGGVAAADVVMLRAPFVETFRAVAGRSVLVYQIDDGDGRSASQRLGRRTIDRTELVARLDDNERERRAGRLLADRVFVNDGPLDAAVEAVAAALAMDLRAAA